MKIVFFTHYYTPEGNAPASRTSEHCKRWIRENSDVDVTVITCAPNVPDGKVYPGYRNRLWPQRESIDGVNVIRVWSFIRPNLGKTGLIVNYVSYLFTALFAFLFFVRRPSAIVATTPQFFCGVAGILAGKLKRVPVVLEVRDIWPESIVTVGAIRRGLLIRTLERIEKWMYRSADHIVTVGPGYRDNILSKVDVHNRISTVTNGVDPDQFDPQLRGSEFANKYGLGDRFVCSYIGTVGRAHGLEIIVRTAERFREAKRDDVAFIIVGGGATLEQLQQTIEDKQLGDLVKTTGRLDKSKMPDALAASDVCLVHLSKVDLFEHVIPSKIFETMAMERGIIMGVRGRARDIVLDAASGVSLEPENDAELFEILQGMTADKESVRSMGQRGRQFVVEHFNRDHLAADMLEIVRRTAAKEVFCLPDRSWEPVVDSKNNSESVTLSNSSR
ncbi:glycosyltransferase family 4 protein [Stieleria sp. JC731]|uniref:glycosyltransferase family 4 protein n=1 Tax=Pirellulaceae TaxID=2691357 RepID=UPI001E4D4D38|nr:glycosyltransferase family 4 protein [Stieleria sp. JC731]MCC9601118.1 glycosyltransferase family 4 protein [Stieleria sp. JC731]